MVNDLPINISNDAIDNERSQKTSVEEKKSTFDEKNYLNVRLSKEDKGKKELRIRLLPMDLKTGSPFVHVHLHNVEVSKDMVEPGKKPFKSYICLNPIKNSFIEAGSHCPFCEENKRNYDLSLKAETPAEKKNYQDTSLSFKTKEAIILRCIERGKEDEGVKFWKFNVKYDNTDAYHQILDLYEQRKRESMEATGEPKNILDLTNGRDLIVTINQGNTENQTSIVVKDYGFDTPLSRDTEQAKAWINDPKTWQDVFTVKPYEYLKLVLDKKIPWFDRDEKRWVSKEEYEEKHGKMIEKANSEVSEAETKYTQPITPSAPVVTKSDDDDLPF